MKSKAILTFLFGLLILFLHHGPTVARSCQSLPGKCSTTYCGNNFAAVAFDVGCHETQYCCIRIAGDSNEVYATTNKVHVTTNKVQVDDLKTLLGQSFRDRFDGIKNSSHYTTKVFVLAQEIKDVLDAATESSDVLKDLRVLKSEFPVTVRSIVWGEKVALVPKRYNEYLYAYYSPVGPRRRVFTWRPGGDVDRAGFWKFNSKDGGKTFTIKNTHYGEYLYAHVSNDGKDLRFIYTWIYTPCDDKSCFWQIEYMGDNEILIVNAMHSEYLVAAGDSLAYNENRRSVFTGMLTLDDRIWKVVLAK